jgi:hypothetical protein
MTAHLKLRNGGAVILGILWALMPCGLLYGALLVAALSNSPVEGASVMALFALGSAVVLTIGPWVWLRLRGGQIVSTGSGAGTACQFGLDLVDGPCGVPSPLVLGASVIS